MVISDFLEYQKRLLHVSLNVINVSNPKANFDYHAVFMVKSLRTPVAEFLIFET